MRCEPPGEHRTDRWVLTRALSPPDDTVRAVPVIPQKAGAAPRGPVISPSGQVLSRQVAFRFALDPTDAQDQLLRSHAGAARFTFNHLIARASANLSQHRAEASYGVPAEELTPALSWSAVSMINAFTQFKNGLLPSSPVSADGERGLLWARQVSADAFECASVNAAQALANFSTSADGTRKGKPVGFPTFKSRHKTSPTFSLRSRHKPAGPPAIRIAGPKAVLLPKIGTVRVHGCTKRVRRLVDAGRLRILKGPRSRSSAANSGSACKGSRRCSTGRAPEGQHEHDAGLDLGVKVLATVADTEGVVLRAVGAVGAVKALQNAQTKLKRANQTLSRTKIGSNGRRKAKDRLTRIHARVAWLRETVAHAFTAWATATLRKLTVEDLHIAGMVQLRNLSRAISDAGMGQVLTQLGYKAGWYGMELAQASRWFASSKACSGCGNVNADLTLSDRTYDCAECGLSIDRDVNAAINLARWQAPPAKAVVQKRNVSRKKTVPKAGLLVA